MSKYIDFFGQHITWYSIMGFLGLLAATLLCVRRRRRFDVELDDEINLMGYAIVGGIIGAKTLALLCMVPQFIEYWEQIHWNRQFFNAIMQTGFVYYGGFGGVILAFYIYCRQYQVNFSNILELIAPAIPLFHVLGRIGCYNAGCCGGVGGFPLQLVEAAMNLVICVTILVIQNRQKMRGATFYLYLFLYGGGRFVLEFFRGDPERGFIGSFSVSQWISVLLIVIAVVSINRKKCYMQKNRKP